MKLTGKCKKDFEKWFFNNYGIEEASFVREEGGFFNLPQSMQWGVIQDFGDSVGINITLYQLDYQEWYGYNIVKFEFGKPVITGGVWRRDKAREEAIKQFNKIYNEK